MVIFLSLLSSISVLLGLVVWLRQRKNHAHQSFAVLTLFISIWIVTNALFLEFNNLTQYVVALISYAAASMTATSLVVFARTLVGKYKFNLNIFLVGLILAVTSVVPGVLATGVENNAIQTTPLIFIYALWVATFLIGGIYVLIKGRGEVSVLRRTQIDSILLGLTMAVIGGVACNLVLPVFGNYNLVALGPAFSVLFIFFFSYSIIKHHLFDIRTAIARFVAYGASVSVLGLGLGYGGYTFYRSGIGGDNTALMFLGIGLAISSLFPAVKSGFDKITQKLFLSGNYDMRKAIDKMATIFSSATSVGQLVTKSQTELKYILGSQYIDIRYNLENVIPVKSSRIFKDDVVRDKLDDSHGNEELVQYLRDESLAVISPLIVNKKTVGYLCVGDKANGTAYNSQDFQFIGIVTDELAIALQNAQRLEEIRHFNEDLKAKIHDATTELRESNKKLRELDETKDEFISMASHQLRTPLTSVKGYISMLLDGDMGELKPAQRQVLEEAYGSSQRMVYLIGDFLNLSRLRTGKFVIERAPVLLPQIIEQEIKQLREAARHKNIDLTYEPPHDFPTLLLDETKIRQVMMNFIDNAIYYSKQSGGKVEISLVKHTNHITFKVVDDGIGVPQKERSKLFTKFYRAENARRARPDGTGVGLFMSKKVVAALGGAILFESKENEGSTFGFRLPLDETNQVLNK